MVLPGCINSFNAHYMVGSEGVKLSLKETVLFFLLVFFKNERVCFINV